MRTTLCALALLFSSAASGSATVPATPAANVLKAWLAAYNAADLQQLEAFKETYHRRWSAQAMRDMLDDRRQTGGYTVLAIEKSQPLALTVLLQENNSDSVNREEVKLAGGDPPTGVSMAIEHGVQRPPALAIPRMTQRQAVAALTARATALAQQDKFSGAILVAHRGRILLRRSWGEADRATGKANALDTQFRLGSMNKMFTAVAVLQLAEAGRLSLDAPFGTYLTAFPNTSAASGVTLRELLDHTGGTGDIFGPDFDAHRRTLRANDDYVRLYAARPLDHPPGEKFEYSNYGFVLLGAVIEKVSGLSYYDYVDQHIFRPAGMSSTGSRPESDALARRARGYLWQNGAWTANDGTLPLRGTAAGGGYSTIGDMFRFAQALQASKLLSSAGLNAATRPAFHDAPSGYGYGYGFEVLDEAGLKSYGHEGGAPGMNGELRVFPNQGYVIVVLSNLDPPAAHRLVDYFSLRMPASG